MSFEIVMPRYFAVVTDSVVSKSGNPVPGPVPNSYFLYYIFIKALILIKFEHNA